MKYFNNKEFKKVQESITHLENGHFSDFEILKAITQSFLKLKEEKGASKYLLEICDKHFRADERYVKSCR